MMRQKYEKKMTPAETMTFILMRRPGATSGSFRELPAAFCQVGWEEKTDDGGYTVRAIRIQGGAAKTLVRRFWPADPMLAFLGAGTEAEYPVGDDVGAAILQALDRLFVGT